MPWFSRFRSPADAVDRLGPLESRALEALWVRTAPASVRDLQPEFTEIAYTTLMTTLDRLYRKGVLDRHKQGRAFFYVPRLTRAEFDAVRAADALQTALGGKNVELGPLLSFFVQAVGNRDRELLDELECLVKTHRAQINQRKS